MPVKKSFQVAEAVAAGESVKSVATRFGIKPGTVYAHCYRCEVSVRPRVVGRGHIPQMYQDGLSTLQIAKLVHMCHKAVAKRLRGAGLIAKDRGKATIEFWREQLAKQHTPRLSVVPATQPAENQQTEKESGDGKLQTR
jgi:hypothetical protein